MLGNRVCVLLLLFLHFRPDCPLHCIHEIAVAESRADSWEKYGNAMSGMHLCYAQLMWEILCGLEVNVCL